MNPLNSLKTIPDFAFTVNNFTIVARLKEENKFSERKEKVSERAAAKALSKTSIGGAKHPLGLPDLPSSPSPVAART